jgi:hypothetical protein
MDMMTWTPQWLLIREGRSVLVGTLAERVMQKWDDFFAQHGL